MVAPHATPNQLAARNRELYDDTSGPVWRLTYERLHGGWELIDLGGRALLNGIARHAGVGRGTAVLDLCCGQGAASRYLSARYGCRVTGVEVNASQVRAARAGVAGMNPEAASRVRTVQADVVRWQPDAAYDVVVSIDSSMLIADLPALCATACHAVRPGGRFYLSAVTAGPRADGALREFAWKQDGMISLLTPSGYARLLRGAGFARLARSDLTPRAVAASRRMQAALRTHRAGLLPELGEDGYRNWVEVGDVYLSAFVHRKLAYTLIAARRS